MEEYYVYIYLDTRKPGIWEYQGIQFEYQPFYVGKGKGDRIKDHLTNFERSQFNIKSNIIDKIFRETGEQPILKKVFENLLEDHAFQKEKELINHFGRIDIKTGILANLTAGGPGVKEKIITLELKNKLRNPQLKRLSPRSQRVDQFDLNGVFIKKYESLRALALELNLTESEKQKVRTNSRGKSKSALGFIWKFDGTTAYVPEKSRINKIKVSQFTVLGEFIKTHDSITEASLSIGCAATSISKCCRGNGNSTGGFRWRLQDLLKFENLL